MTMQLKLSKQLEERLRQEAQRLGQKEEVVAVQVLDQHLPPALDVRQTAAVALLRTWAEEDEALTAEDLAANAALLQTVDEDRPSHRKLFRETREDG